MMSFKSFLVTQDDGITDEEAIRKYAEYKQEFNRQQLNEFFVTHKEEEWFKLKYHPDLGTKKTEELKAAVKRRVEVFEEIFNKGENEGVSVDGDKQKELVKILDSVVIKLEGGSELDLSILDKSEEEIEENQKKKQEAKALETKTRESSSVEKEEKDDLDAVSDGEGPGPDGDDLSEPRPLHKTSSIFLRNLPPAVTVAEVENICRRYNGFLRSCIADPAPDKRWFRRGWVTFKRDVKIKEICFNLNNIRIKECEMGPVVNKDLTRRIRTVSGFTVDRKVVRSDIKLAAKIITNLDSRWGLWAASDTAPAASKDDIIGLVGANPLLANIKDYLIEEENAEEEELLGKKNGSSEDGELGEEGITISRDEELIKVLDKLIFYLRIVHSVDFYNQSEYSNEDEMPNRCGLLHARGVPTNEKVTAAQLQDYCKQVEKKMGALLEPKQQLAETEVAKLGIRNQEDEVEKFVANNTQEQGKDKWLCPLSGKKFKGPEFVRKHIFNKYGEQVDAVKKEVQYFNNYLKDPKRPQLPENPNKVGGKRKANVSDGVGGGPGGDQARYARDVDNRFAFEGAGLRQPPHPTLRGRSVRERLGYGVGGQPGIRVTHAGVDPRSIIDYSDVDNFGGLEFF